MLGFSKEVVRGVFFLVLVVASFLCLLQFRGGRKNGNMTGIEPCGSTEIDTGISYHCGPKTGIAQIPAFRLPVRNQRIQLGASGGRVACNGGNGTFFHAQRMDRNVKLGCLGHEGGQITGISGRTKDLIDLPERCGPCGCRIVVAAIAVVRQQSFVRPQGQNLIMTVLTKGHQLSGTIPLLKRILLALGEVVVIHIVLFLETNCSSFSG
mmetsp:Transcript_12310/g.23555  ORF Transcript_12310/g.23555 Transcript_12310/m.23555 type:complete len:209 (-) Transcript_12310:355-981(-)